MTDDLTPTGVRRTALVWLAFVRIGLWMVRRSGPWRSPIPRHRA